MGLTCVQFIVDYLGCVLGGGGAVFENELCYCLVIIEIRNSNKHKTQEKKRLKFGLLSSLEYVLLGSKEY